MEKRRKTSLDDNETKKKKSKKKTKNIGVRLRDNGVEYRGGLDADGFFHGLGLLRTIAESQQAHFYYGDWVHGRPNGKAVVFDGQNLFEGNVLEDKYPPMGKERFQWEDAVINIEHGRGVNVYLDAGDRYEGEFDQGKVTGYGTYYWSDGRYQACSFVDNNVVGWGHYYWPDGVYFEGNYVDDKRKGQGVLYFPDGRKLIANYENDLRIGIARMEWANGDVWDGVFLSHQRARGKRVFATGDTMEGLFLDYELKNGGIEAEDEWMTYRRVMENGEVQEKQGLWKNEVFIERGSAQQ
eukprot:TRINITY_DN8744_c0_g1_i1.p1 TRINITY_DN8744_c0_g1~~TRINITY_DN8744_c0_g1_i1.p1  ORF type:complete len:296 (+),score=59.15 TRINITY_DN8744_c0_g1_i1:23-910(+)